jgi:hypothetical protein
MKNLYYFLSLALFLNLFISDVTVAWIPEGINLTKTSNGYNINFTLPSFEIARISAEGNEYDQLVIPGYGVMSEVGLPSLPLISFNLYISNQEMKPEFVIENITLDERDLKHKIYPFQMPWEKSKLLSERPFTINAEYYNTTGNLDQSFVSKSEPFIIGGVKGVTITLYPFRYNPIEDKLIFVKNGRINILLNQQVLPVPNKSRLVQQYFRGVFANYEGTSFRASSKYLIITAPSFETGMQQFVTHKVSNGFEVDMFSTDITGTTTSTIKNFIQQRYNNPATKPEFVLLVGDVAQIPAWTGQGAGNPTTDVNYVQLEGGDYYADAFIGRFSVSNDIELQNAINKSVFMEENIGTLNKKNIYMASTDNWQISEATHNYIIDEYFDPANYTNFKLYTHTYGATTQQLINALNDNQIFAIYSGHGSEYSWADGPPLSQSQVENLTNTWYPFVFSFACVTGSYHVSECFGETWLRTENGAATFYGSSVNSYWDEDDMLEKKIFEAMFEDNLTRVTPMFDMGKVYLVNYYGGGIGPGTTTLRYVEMYNLMGDPSMPVVEMGPPCPIDPAFNPNPVHNAIDIPITSNTLTWENGLGASQLEVWFGEVGNLVQVYTGSLITSFSLAPYEPLEYSTDYGWQVKGMNDTCSVPGTVWKFTTMQDPNLIIDTLFYDDFTAGTGNWTITNDGGVCVWEIRDVSEYTLPPTAVGNCIAVDTDDCNGTSGNGQSTATHTGIDATNYGTVWLEFDNDWQALGSSDFAYVDVSTDGGSSWQNVLTFDETDVRNTHEVWDLTTMVAGSVFDIRFKTVQPGWDWWWAIDNVLVHGSYVTPVELTSFIATTKGTDVELNWLTATETNNHGFEIERKNVGGPFEMAGFVAGYGTTSEPKAYSFIDSKLELGNYAYRLKQIDLNGSITYSSEVEVEIKAPNVFSLEQNYPNPFNPSTKIKYSIPDVNMSEETQSQHVSLKVYDILGNEVVTLVNGEQTAGSYEIEFNASDFPSGIYFYQLSAGKFVDTKKTILLK